MSGSCHWWSKVGGAGGILSLVGAAGGATSGTGTSNTGGAGSNIYIVGEQVAQLQALLLTLLEQVVMFSWLLLQQEQLLATSASVRRGLGTNYQLAPIVQQVKRYPLQQDSQLAQKRGTQITLDYGQAGGGMLKLLGHAIIRRRIRGMLLIFILGILV